MAVFSLQKMPQSSVFMRHIVVNIPAAAPVNYKCLKTFPGIRISCWSIGHSVIADMLKHTDNSVLP